MFSNTKVICDGNVRIAPILGIVTIKNLESSCSEACYFVIK